MIIGKVRKTALVYGYIKKEEIVKHFLLITLILKILTGLFLIQRCQRLI